MTPIKNIPTHAPAQTLANWLGITTQSLAALRRDEILPKTKNNLYPIEETVQAYLAHIGGKGTKERIEKQRLYNLERDGEKKALEVGKISGELIEREEVREDAQRIAGALKAGLRRLESTLPPQVVGLGEADIQKKIAEVCQELQGEFSDMTSDLYKEAIPVEVVQKRRVKSKKK